jgi:hypothetical protein
MRSSASVRVALSEACRFSERSYYYHGLLGLLINFNVALIKDGITRIVNGLKE